MFLYVVLAAACGIIGGILLSVCTKKKEGVAYGALDNAGVVTNIVLTIIYAISAPFYMFIGMIAEPYKNGFWGVVGAIIAIIMGSTPLIAGLGIGASVALRKRGKSTLSFLVQLAGVASIVLTVALYAIFVGTLLAPLN